MAKKFIIDQGHVHEVDSADDCKVLTNKKQPPKTKSEKWDGMQISPDRMYKWLVKKAELFREQ